MSKEAAMAMMTGQPTTQVNPSILTGDMPPAATPADLNPSVIDPAQKLKLESDRAAIYARKEARLQKEREEFNQKQVAFEKERVEAKSLLDRMSAFESKRKENPVQALKDIGFSETEIFNFMAEGNGTPKELSAEELAAKIVDEKLSDYDKKQVEAQTLAQKARDDGLISNHKKAIATTIETNKEKYEYVHFQGAVGQELVEDIINQVLNVEDVLIPYAEACQMAEDYYEGQYDEMSKLKKRQVAQANAAAVEEKAQLTQGQKTSRTRTITDYKGEPVKQATPRTLTNRTTATVSSTRSLNETPEQKRERLISKLRNGS